MSIKQLMIIIATAIVAVVFLFVIGMSVGYLDYWIGEVLE